MPLEITTSVKPEQMQLPDVVWGDSSAVRSLNRMVLELSDTDIPLLLAGENGTGKEVYAQAIHRLAGRSDFRKLTCAGMDPAQLQAEIQRPYQQGNVNQMGHTLFLDEIDAMNPECQRLFLSFIASPGSSYGAKIRLISSATCDMEKEIEAGRFRRDLYFRLNGACLRLPPLRERLGDLIALAEHFLKRHASELKRTPPELNPETVEVLLSYHWPGNIRELENVARKMVAFGETRLAVSDLRVPRVLPHQGQSGTARLSSLKVAARAASRQTERELILQALERTKWNRKRAARELQISYKSLLYKLKQIETLGTKSDK
jgi:two-component system, NtrC family, response regulator AtoC